MKQTTPQALKKAVFEALEDRRHFSSTSFANGVLTLKGDMDKNNAMSATLIGNQFVVGFAGNSTTVVPLADLKQIKVVAGKETNLIALDRDIARPVRVLSNGGKNEITSGDPYVSVYEVGSTDTPDQTNTSGSHEGAGGKTTGTGGKTTGSGGKTTDTGGKTGTGGKTTGTGGSTSDAGGKSTGTGGNGGKTTGAGGSTSGTGGFTSNSGGSTSGAGGSTSGHTGNIGGGTSSTGLIHAKITAVTSVSVIAGQAVNVQGLASALGKETALSSHFHWDFGDTTQYSQYNQLDGWNAAHMYYAPGKYTVTLTVTGADGEQSADTMDVNVAASSALRPIYVSAAGDDRNDGSNPDGAVRTVARANQLLSANTQLLFRAGDTFSMTSGILANYNNVTITSYGNGPRPVLMWTGGVGNYTMISSLPWTSNLTVSGLTFDSVYDKSGDKSPPTAVKAMGTNVAVVDNQFLNITYAVDSSAQPTGLLVQGNVAPSATGIRAYFVWVQGTDITIIGNDCVNSTREHIVRVGGADQVLIAYNNFTNMGRENVDPQDIAKSTIAVQVGSYAYVAHNTLTTGPVGVGPNNAPAIIPGDPAHSAAASFNWSVFENNTLNAPFLLQPGANHTMVRGNVAYTQDSGEFLINGWTSTFHREVVDATFQGNTVFDSGTTGYFLRMTGAASGISLMNNLYVAPNLQFGIKQSAPLSIQNTDLSSFSLISGNVWPAYTWSHAASGGENFVGPWWSQNYQTPNAWLANPQVKGDQFKSVTLPANYQNQIATSTKTGLELFAAAA